VEAASNKGLPHTSLHCNTLQHAAPHCTTLQHTAPRCTTLHHTATHYNTLQHTATHTHLGSSQRGSFRGGSGIKQGIAIKSATTAAIVAIAAVHVS